MSDAKKYDVKFEDGKLKVLVDTNQDGQALLDLSLIMAEGLSELVAKGTPIEGRAMFNYKMDGASLHLSLDTDKDGEDSLELKVDLGEALDEAKGLMG